jgi:hypothetical protein
MDVSGQMRAFAAFASSYGAIDEAKLLATNSTGCESQVRSRTGAGPSKVFIEHRERQHPDFCLCGEWQLSKMPNDR